MDSSQFCSLKFVSIFMARTSRHNDDFSREDLLGFRKSWLSLPWLNAEKYFLNESGVQSLSSIQTLRQSAKAWSWVLGFVNGLENE